MHELGVTERILEVTLTRATQAAAHRVTDIHLELGEEAGIDAGAICLHWPIVSAGTIADGAALHFEPAPAPRVFRLVAVDVD